MHFLNFLLLILLVIFYYFAFLNLFLFRKMVLTEEKSIKEPLNIEEAKFSFENSNKGLARSLTLFNGVSMVNFLKVLNYFLRLLVVLLVQVFLFRPQEYRKKQEALVYLF